MSTSGEHGYPDTGHTRTHLPGGDPYGGAPRRTPRSSSRSLITVVGVVVLLIAAIAFANRDNSSSPTDGSPKGAAHPPAAPTAASGHTPVPTKQNGIPTNFPHTKQGAESAAANYAVALGSAEMFDTGWRHQIVDTVYASDIAAAKLSAMDRAYSDEKFLANIGLAKDGSAPKGETFISRTIPVGTRTTASAHDSATVEVWYTSLFGLSGESSKNPVTESWYTTTYELRWTDGDWKITDFQQKDGPVPVGRDQRASTANDMTKAVEEFGGFTYAR
ncbi:hypothetical protein AB0H51_15335 [Streptomyces griseoluteus]|uniref:hypothetical protein n=1 Tax=Streptomyces griseoluteus TaxID=29306 RepID=UPI0033F4C1BC